MGKLTVSWAQQQFISALPVGHTKRRATADRAETADHIHKDATDRYAPCLRALLLFARPIVNIGDFIIVLY